MLFFQACAKRAFRTEYQNRSFPNQPRLSPERSGWVCGCVRACVRACVCVCVLTDFNGRGIIFLDFAYTVGVNILFLSKSIFWFITAIFEFSKFLFSIFLIFRTKVVYILWILCMHNKILYNLKKKVDSYISS